jgi:hypothetical protein
MSPCFSVGARHWRTYSTKVGAVIAQPAKLCYLGHALMENHHGLAVGGGASQGIGTAERDEALMLVDRRHGRRRRRITLGDDKAYKVLSGASAYPSGEGHG